MRVLICEDNDDKFAKIQNVLTKMDVNESKISRAETFHEFSKKLREGFDLCIADFWMPVLSNSDSEPQNVANDILAEIDEVGGFDLPVLVITEHYSETLDHLESYKKKGCIVYDYSETETWSHSLEIYKSRAQSKHKYEFIVLVAVEVEKQAYFKIQGLNAKSVYKQNLEFVELQLGDRFGAVIQIPDMGLVNATAITSQVLDKFEPKIICMSGICGGIGSKADLGSLLIAEMCWEYQSGKWIEDAFVTRPYQEKMHRDLRLPLKEMAATKGYIDKLEEGFSGTRASNKSDPRLVIFTSGSAVIADEKKLAQVKEQHDKVEGLDMEIYGFYRAVSLSNTNATFFAAKTVVDNADSGKDDKIQEYGSYISAKFCLDAITRSV